MPAPTITQNIARRTRSRIHLTKTTEIAPPEYRGKRFTKLPIDDPFVPASSFQPRLDIDEPEEVPEEELTLAQRLRRARLLQLQAFPIVPVPQTFSWSITIPASSSIQVATPNLFGTFNLKQIQFYTTQSALDRVSWSMTKVSQTPTSFAEHIAGTRIQPSETPLFTIADELQYALSQDSPQTVPLNQKIGLFAQRISINVTSVPPAGSRRIAIHLTYDATF